MLTPADDPISDAGPRSVPPGTERLCAASRTIKPVGEMIRFVVGPGGDVVPDLKRKLPGRGVWVTAQRSALAEAVKRKAFGRSFRREVLVAPDLARQVEFLLERSALDALAIAAKAGSVVAGFGRVETAVASQNVAALLHAADAGADGTRKIAAAVRRHLGEAAGRIVIVEAFTSSQLDLALGRSNVVHAALLAGRESNGFLMRYAGLERFRSDNGGDLARP